MALRKIEICPNCHYKSLYIRDDGSKKCYKCGYEVSASGQIINRGEKRVKKVAKTKKIYSNQLCPKCGFHKLYIGVKKVDCYHCGFSMDRNEFDKKRFSLLNKTTLMFYLNDVFTKEELKDKLRYLEKIGYIKIINYFTNKYGVVYNIETKRYKMQISFSKGKIEFVQKR